MTPTETAANTISFEKLEAGLSIYDKIGWVINRIEWRLSNATLGYFNSTGDQLKMAISNSNTPTTIVEDDPRYYAISTWNRVDFGTAASASLEDYRHVDDFSGLPGGGILVLPSPLYCAIQGSGLSTASQGFIRLYFSPIEMAQDDYFSLVQSRQLILQQ